MGAVTTFQTAANEESQTVSLGPGWTGCLNLSAEDSAGNLGWVPFATAPCFAAPVDDVSLLPTKGWEQQITKGTYLNTISTTKDQGEAMSLRGAYFTHLGVVVTKGPGYGKIKISDDDGLINKTYSLAAAKVKKKVVINVPVPSEVLDGQPDASITLRVVTDGKPVKIDGIGVLDNRFGG